MPIERVYVSNKTKSAKTAHKGRFAYNRAYNGYALIDLWNKTPLYGKIDTNYNIVYPSEAFLRTISGERGELFALNFVVDAFQKMGEYLSQGEANGNLDQSSVFFHPLKPKGGWVSINQQYFTAMNAQWKVFLQFLSRNGRNVEIRTFDNFIVQYKRFAETNAKLTPMTKSGHILKSYCPHSISGLVIEIDRKDYSDDFTKIKSFFQDPFFKLYANTATKFGFSIDKNAPWRLVANLASPAWQVNPCLNTIMQNYDYLNLDNIFERYYYRTYKQDVELLEFYAFAFYNGIVRAQSEIDIPVVGRQNRVSVAKVKRKAVLPGSAGKKYNDLFWLQMYYDIRIAEMDVLDNSISRNAFFSVKEEIEMLYYRDGYDSALEYTNERLKDILKLKISNFRNLFARGQAYSPLVIDSPVGSTLSSGRYTMAVVPGTLGTYTSIT